MEQHELPYAETVNYWNTGRRDAATWLEDSFNMVHGIGGNPHGYQINRGNSPCIAMRFDIAGRMYNIVWPILPTKGKNNDKATQRQAATFIFHEVKACVLRAKVLGVERAFIQYLSLGNGLTVQDFAISERLQLMLPAHHQ